MNKITTFGFLAMSFIAGCALNDVKGKVEPKDSEIIRLETVREGCLPITKTVILDLNKDKKAYEDLYNGYYVEEKSPYKYRYNDVDSDVSLTDNKLLRRVTFYTTECNRNIPDSEI